MARQMLRKLPRSVRLDDLLQVGMLALWDCLQRFDANNGAQFDTFATQRVQGAMLDLLRADDWAPRGERRLQRRLEAATEDLTHTVGRAPRESELAAAVGLPLPELQALRTRLAAHFVSIEDLQGDDGAEDYLDRHITEAVDGPDRLLQDLQEAAAVDRAITGLPARERMVLDLQLQGLSLSDIGHVLGVSEARVCQIAKAAVERIRVRLAVAPGLPSACAVARGDWLAANVRGGFV